MPSAARVARIEREYNLAPGAYWRATRDHRARDRVTIPAGRMLMIDEIKIVDDVPHTVVLRHHPSESSHHSRRLLLREFLDGFEPIDAEQAQAIRDAEIAEIEGQILASKTRIETLSSDSTAVIAAIEAERRDNPDSELAAGYQPVAGLPAPGATSNSLEAVSPDQLAQLQAAAGNQVALVSARAELITRESHELQRLAKAISPFHLERAAAMSAQAKAMVADAKKVFDALSTLELYTGKDVAVETLVEGDRSPDHGAYAIRQRCLFMDEESLINVEFGGADFRDLGAFAALLRDDTELRDRLLPETRCIAAMRYRRHRRDYNDTLANMVYNGYNAAVFLLVRDGDRVDAVFSPLDYLPRLFPTSDDMDRPFQGIDGERITLDDVNYADSRDRQDSIALMYKRLLILLWGLYDRDALFGHFDLEALHGRLNLLDTDVQAAIFDFIADDDDTRLLGRDAVPLGRLFADQFARLAPEATVSGYWPALIDVDTAPHCFTNPVHRQPDQIRHATERCSIATVCQHKGHAAVRLRVEGFSHATCGTRNTTAMLQLDRDRGRMSLGYHLLVLDGLTAADIEPRLYSREARERYEVVMPVLIRAYHHLRQAEADAQPLIDAVAGSVCDTAREHATRAVLLAARGRRWSTAARGSGRAIVTAASRIAQALEACGMARDCSRLVTVNQAPPPAQVATWLQACALAPEAVIRVAIDNHARLVIYHAPDDDTLAAWPWPTPWVERMTTKLAADGLIAEPATGPEIERGVFERGNPRELIVWERHEAPAQRVASTASPPRREDFTERGAVNLWLERARSAPRLKPDLFAQQRRTVEAQTGDLAMLIGEAPDQAHIAILFERAATTLRASLGRRDRMVNTPIIRAPIGLIATPRLSADGGRIIRWLCWQADALTLLYRVGDTRCRDRITQLVHNTYQHGDHIAQRLTSEPLGDLAYTRLRDVPPTLRVLASTSTVGARGALAFDLNQAKRDELLWCALSPDQIAALAQFSTDDLDLREGFSEWLNNPFRTNS